MRVVRWYADHTKAAYAEAKQIGRLEPPRNIKMSAPKGAMRLRVARIAWLGADPHEWDKAVLARMPGWTKTMAKHRFGPRYRLSADGKRLIRTTSMQALAQMEGWTESSAYRHLKTRKLAIGRRRRDNA